MFRLNEEKYSTISDAVIIIYRLTYNFMKSRLIAHILRKCLCYNINVNEIIPKITSKRIICTYKRKEKGYFHYNNQRK